MEKTFSPCPYCDGKNNDCKGCELQAYRAIGTVEHLTELVEAEREGRARQGQCIWCRNGAYMQQKYGRAVPDFCAHCGRDLRGESQND